MTIERGDVVRPNNPSVGLPNGSVWRVVSAAGGLKLEPENGVAQYVARDATAGRRFPERDFDKVVLCRGQWVAAKDACFLRVSDGIDPFATCLQNLPKTQTSAVATAEAHLHSAANAAVAAEGLLEAARKLEAERKVELQAAKVAKAKADKEAAAKAKVEEGKRQLSARLHADHCLGEATLALIAEVSRLNNGGSEHVAHSSIADHVNQLQPLAKSYGYRIAKPSLLAQVVKL